MIENKYKTNEIEKTIENVDKIKERKRKTG